MNAPTVCQWHQCVVTWWLYNGNKPLTAVRGHVTLTPEEVRNLALHQLSIMPGMAFPNLPFEQRERIKGARVTL